MHKTFNSLNELFAHIKEDKEWVGAEESLYNRYPIRFVLFDNFADFNEFILNRPDGIYKHSIETMLDQEYPDSFLSYTELSREIRQYIKMVPVNDYIIYPFSEMARFYDNENKTEFDALINTIRGQQAPEGSQQAHVRLYIPIVGMQGKMGKFFEDNITFVWEYKSDIDKGVYKLIVTNGSTYEVSGLKDRYSVVNNLYEWLKLWEKGEEVKQTIICSSPNIFSNFKFAQPDNAFTYCKCDNAFQFLVNGLQLDFGITEEPKKQEMTYWEKLASLIDITTFNFDEFVKERIDTFTLQSGIDFIKSWFDCETDFDRWLLTIYYRKIADKNSYIYKAISICVSLNKAELFSNIATLIFDLPNKEGFISERLDALTLAASQNVQVTDFARTKINAKLKAIAASPEQGGYHTAIKLLTPLTQEELRLAVEWVAGKKANIDEIRNILPNLYNYLRPLCFNSLSPENQWISRYFQAYRNSKISDNIEEDVTLLLQEKNANASTFLNWYDQFKTVRTYLHNRQDIDVYYWIDGLGVDWIPFVREIISQYSKEDIFLNEIYIAVSDYPTTTSINKSKLLSLLPEGAILPKIGDIDSYAHSHKTYPEYIIEEMNIVELAIRKVLDEYNGKKIAFVSDHGITYLSQKENGLNIAGVVPDHEGRCATFKGASIVSDNNYIVLQEGKKICSLTHKSLANKIDKGHGAHGGCTPEEILVPIIIVSSQKNTNNFSASMENEEIKANYPVLNFIIKGLSTIDIPTLLYNGVKYYLSNVGGNNYKSERLNLVETATKVTLCVNDEAIKKFNVKISTGVEEEDLF